MEYVYEKEHKTAPARATQAALSAARLADVPNAFLRELEEAVLSGPLNALYEMCLPLLRVEFLGDSE